MSARPRRPMARATLKHRLDLLTEDYRQRAVELRDLESGAAFLVLEQIRLLLEERLSKGLRAELSYGPGEPLEGKAASVLVKVGTASAWNDDG